MAEGSSSAAPVIKPSPTARPIPRLLLSGTGFEFSRCVSVMGTSGARTVPDNSQKHDQINPDDNQEWHRRPVDGVWRNKRGSINTAPPHGASGEQHAARS